MFDLARLRGTMLAVASVALGLVILGAMLRWATDRRPGSFPSMGSKMDVGLLRRAGGRIALAARDRRRDPRSGDNLGVVLGASTMYAAIDPTLLADGDREGPARWLDLCCADATIGDLDRIARLLDRGGLRPSVAVVGINLGMLARSGDLLADDMLVDRPPDAFREPAAVPARKPAGLIGSLGRLARRSGDWLRPNLMKFQQIKNIAMFEWRVATLLGAGAEIDGALEPAPEYWKPPSPWMSAATADFVEWQVREYTRKGWFSADAFGTDSPNARALERLVVGLRRRGARVVLVLLPESTRLRERVPPEAIRRLTALVGALPEGDAPEVVDLRGTITDAWLVDLVHLGPLGREEVTRRLARHLAGPPAIAARR